MARSLKEDEKYFTLIEGVPRQYKEKDEENETVEMIATSVETTLAASFAFSFAISLLLNGVMSQLWNIFNTL